MFVAGADAGRVNADSLVVLPGRAIYCAGTKRIPAKALWIEQKRSFVVRVRAFVLDTILSGFIPTSWREATISIAQDREESKGEVDDSSASIPIPTSSGAPLWQIEMITDILHQVGTVVLARNHIAESTLEKKSTLI